MSDWLSLKLSWAVYATQMSNTTKLSLYIFSIQCYNIAERDPVHD